MPENILSLSVESMQSGAAFTSWRQLSVHAYVKILIIGSLFCYLFNNEIGSLVNEWQTDNNWSHGWLIPAFSLYFINQHKNEILNLKLTTSYIGLFLLICGIVFYPLNIVHFRYGYFQPLTMIATLGAIVLFLGGWKLIKHTWLPIVFLIFAVPLPSRYYVKLTMPMRKIAAEIATVLLDIVPKLDATVSGVIIDVVYKGKQLSPALNVAEACSGMRLLMAFMALGVAMAYLHYRPIWQRLILLVSTIPIAIFCNMVRVTVTGFIYVFIGSEYAEGLYHDLLGLLMLPLAFGLYYFLAWFMESIFVAELEDKKEDIIVRRR